jgi:hypothetical protein
MQEILGSFVWQCLVRRAKVVGRAYTMLGDADPDIPILKQAKAEYAKLQ